MCNERAIINVNIAFYLYGRMMDIRRKICEQD